ncbi:MAG: hypothetical protein E7540_04665 [Ruminococcaceae bacterium]|nr:hypothetical protein [Oscillospiraceae bacterium]
MLTGKEESDILFKESKKELLNKEKGGALSVFGIALLCAACFFVPYIIYDKGYFLFFGDFNVQQIPFYTLCHEAIRNGEIGWSFITDLGANFIGSYTFYTITSPFFLLTLPFPTTFVPYLMGPLLILKFGCAALTSFLYIRRFTRKVMTAQLAALLYAFSGFSVYNIFFNHFHEAIVFFPLLLLAFELLVTENKRGVFALAVAVCAVVNYFFFVGMLVFGLIYMIVRIVSKAIKPRPMQYFAIFFELILGILLAAAVLLPSYLAISGNSRVTDFDFGWNSIFYGKESIYGNIFEVFFFPPDLPARPVMFPEANVKWSSLGGWMPVFSMVGVFVYCFANKGSWLKRIIIVCAVMAFVPILNSAFYAFNDSFYVRWFFMPILMMALATALAIEDSKIDFTRGYRWVLGITLVITLVIGFFPNTTSQNGQTKIGLGLFTEPDNIVYIVRFWVTCLIAIAGLAILAILLKHRKKNLNIFLRNSIICVVILSVVYANFFIANGKSHSYTREDVVDNLIEGSLDLEGDPDTFRIDTYSCMDNTAMFLGYSSINAFHSIVPPSIMEFYEFVGENRDVASRPETNIYPIRSMLSVKYLLCRESGESFENTNSSTKMPGFNYIYNYGGFDVYENTNFIGYGFSYDAYTDYKYLKDLSAVDRSKIMLSAILLNEEQIQKYGYMFDEYTEYCTKTGKTTVMDYTDCKQAAQERNLTSAKSFKVGKNSFTATVEREKDTLVFFSVPYDSGWTATVNGKNVEIEKVNVGFMAVPVKAGDSEIVFSYKTPGLKTGIIVSAVSAAVLVFYLAAVFIWRRRHKVCCEYPEGEELLKLWQEQEYAELIQTENQEEEIE